jgi:hypothetical protein
MDDKALWRLMWEAMAELREIIEPAIDPVIAKSGLDQRGWGLLLAALTFEPENTTPAYLMVRVPYTAAEEYLLRLSKAAGMGFLEEVRAGEFRLTPAGRTALDCFIESARSGMAEADPLSREEGERLAGLLDRLVNASLKTEPPPETWSITLSYKLMPEREQAMPYIEQVFSCLAAYRDDAHLAAWQDSDLSATALEVLTLIWRKEVSSFAEITRKLVARGHPSQVYLEALEELHSRGFILRADEETRLTSAGRRFRQQIETDTDRYFYKPWGSLSQEEKGELGSILENLRAGLKSRNMTV